MSTKKSFIVVFAIIALSIAVGIYIYPSLPAQIASHWGSDGQVNGYMGKFWGIFLLPVIMVFLTALLYWLPSIDPKKKNVASFRKIYNGVIVGIIAFLFYIYALTILWNTGHAFDMNIAISIPIAGLWYLLGVALPKTKQNWFMGIRTPWTLESERVWKETHEFGGKLFRYSAIAALVGLLFPDMTLWFVLIPIIFSSLATVVYSYISYQSEHH
jgi:uncharacterized membrane protein